MNARIVGVLIVLLVVLGGGALLIRGQQGAQQPAVSGTLGQPLLKDLKAADVAAISIRAPGSTLTLQRKDDRWTIAERGDFTADLEKVRAFVLKAIELKVGQAEPIGEKDRARLRLDESGTLVEFKSSDGKRLAALTLGKKYFKSEPANPEKALGDGRFVMIPGEDKRVVIVSDPLAQATTTTAEWVAKSGIQAELVKSLEVKFADGSAWRIERSGDNADWKLDGLQPGEKLEITKANSASYSLSIIEVVDVLPKDASPAVTGLDKPTTAVAHTFDGLAYTLQIGKLVDDNYHVTVAIAGEPRPEGKDAAERAKKLAERLPREKALEGHVLLVPKSKLEDVLKKRPELLEKPEEAKKKQPQ